MATHVGIGFSQAPTTTFAAREAAIQAKLQTGQQSVDFAVIFSTVHYNPFETLHTINQTLNQTKIFGCTTAGIILSERIETRGIVVLAVHTDDIAYSLHSVNEISP